ncbi:MAG: DEAD/DEAH box helicase [Candidatus Omnitrophota bacterium]
MKLKIHNSIIIADVSYDDREKAKSLGFRWNNLTRHWQTTDSAVIQAVIEKYGENETILEMMGKLREKEQEQENAWLSTKFRIEAGEYLPYQDIRQYYPAKIRRLCHSQNGNILIFTKYEDKINYDLWQELSARWDKTLGCRTVSFSKISEAVEFCQDYNFVLTAEVMTEYQKFEAEKEQKIVQSRAETSDITIPAPEGKTYFPYQRAGIEYISTHQNILLADEMGLGKTIQVIGYLNLQQTCPQTVIVCPASLKINWKNELQSWLVYPADIRIVKEQDDIDHADIAIINYDIVSKFKWDKQFDLLVLDEAHYIKNNKAQRTRNILGHKKLGLSGIQATKKIYLTGTPIKNRPIELWTQIHSLDSKTWSDFWGYAKRYCNAYNGGYGWDMSGASNLEELQEKLRTSVMIRRMKADVLTELPAKIRQVIELSANGNKKAIEEEWSAYRQHQEKLSEMKAKVEVAKLSDNKEEYEQAVKNLRVGMTTMFTEIARLRHETAVAKIPAVIEHIENIIETSEKVVVFAHHHDVIDAIQEKFGSQAVHLTGQDNIEARQKAVEEFQTNPKVLIFIGSISAAGVGITLTSASRVVFAELDWTPAQNSQAEDRCHRIGQKNSVLIQHLVLEGSLDAHIAKTIVAKQNIIDAALDKEIVAEKSTSILPIFKDEEESVIWKKGETITVREYTNNEKTEMIEKLKIIAGMCDGARQRDMMGFNRFDTLIGHQLASQTTLSQKQAVIAEWLVKKYRKQLEEVN